MCACIKYFDHVVFMSDALLWEGHQQYNLTIIRGPTIQTYEGPQGPGTMLLKSGTVPEIRGLLRPMTLSYTSCNIPGKKSFKRLQSGFRSAAEHTMSLSLGDTCSSTYIHGLNRITIASLHLTSYLELSLKRCVVVFWVYIAHFL